MFARLRRSDGFTLVELLVVMSISLVVFGATLTAWVSITHSNRALESQEDNAEEARVSLDRAARQLRNLANPTVNAITTIDRATDYDFIFQTSDPSKTWVRYCLQTTGSASPSAGILWENESSNAITSNMRDTCPGKDWSRSVRVVSHVTNKAGGVDRDIFTFECSLAAAATCPSGTADYPKITNVGMSLWVDGVTTDRVTERNVSTSVYLRNQNEAPTARISTPTTISLPLRKYLLNGSGSTDPEQRTLEYFWFQGAAPTDTQIASTACTSDYPGTVWQGVTYTKTFDSSTPVGGSADFWLLVRDPGCLTSLTKVTVSNIQ